MQATGPAAQVGGGEEAHLRRRLGQALQPVCELLHGRPTPGQLVAAQAPRRGGQLLRSRRGEGVEGRRGGRRGGHLPRRQAKVGRHAKVRVHLKQVRQRAVRLRRRRRCRRRCRNGRYRVLHCSQEAAASVPKVLPAACERFAWTAVAQCSEDVDCLWFGIPIPSCSSEAKSHQLHYAELSRYEQG